MILGAEAAQQVIERNQAEPCGVIRVSCPPAWLYDHIADMISKFMRLYPQVNIHLEVTNKNIDLLNDGIDIALRIRFPPLEDSDQVMKILKNPQCIVGHCELVQQHGMPETPLDLCGYPSIGLGNSEQKVYGHYTAERMVKSKSYTYTTFDCERHDWCTRCGIKRSWDCSITFCPDL